MDSEPLKIDVESVIRKRLPRYSRFIPRPLVRWVERTICQNEMNDMLDYTAGRTGAEFCRAVLEKLDITYTVHGAENLPADRRVTVVSNHPLGGLDGIAMIDFVASVYGEPLKFPVNDLLMAIKPLAPVFLPVNKHGSQSREAGKAIDEAFRGPDPVIIFPAGLCSRRLKEGIADLQWHKMFVNKSIAAQRPVIPVYFSGHNSSFFYNFARLRERSGIRLNIEMVYLPREVFRSRGTHFDIFVGKPVSWQSLRGGADATAQASRIREMVYELPKQNAACQ